MDFTKGATLAFDEAIFQYLDIATVAQECLFLCKSVIM